MKKKIKDFIYIKFSILFAIYHSLTKNGKSEYRAFVENSGKYVSFKNYYKESANYKLLFIKFINLKIRYEATEEDYFIYEFYKRTEAEIATYITNGRRSRLFRAADDEKYWNIFGNKQDFFGIFKEYMQNECIFVKGAEDEAAFREFCRGREEIIVKPVKGERGQGIRKFEITDEESILEAWKGCINMGDAVQVEKVLKNAPEIAAFHPQSLNSIRLSIVLDKAGNPHIMAALIRTGTGENIVDNGHHDGVFASINPENGMIITSGYNQVGESFECHPDSGIRFIGTVIPKWDELKKLAVAVARTVPSMRYIGWDYILDDSGKWILIEGNEPGAIDIHQQSLRKGLYKDYSELIFND